MIHTKEEILIIAHKVISDLEKTFYNKEAVKGASFKKDDELMRGSRKGEKAALWTVAIIEPYFDTAIFLTISDETGEPLYIQNKHGVAEIEKDADGNYK
jgi:hypothetical protein